MLLSQIQEDLRKAQKTQDANQTSSLRYLLASIHNEEIAKGRQLEDNEVLEIISKLTKQHKESIEAFEKGGRQDLIAKEKAGLIILEQYLPAQLSADEIENFVKEAIDTSAAQSISDMGKVMSVVMEKTKGRANGATIAEIVKNLLTR